MKPTARKRRLKWSRKRAEIEAANLAGGGRHRLDVSEREVIEAARLHRPLSGAQEVINAQLQTEEAWRAVWADAKKEQRR